MNTIIVTAFWLAVANGISAASGIQVSTVLLTLIIADLSSRL